MENDTNMLLFTKKENKNADKETQVAKVEKKKLTRKERIRLEKVVERKDKSAKVNSIHFFVLII
jgi:hypothetical protein